MKHSIHIFFSKVSQEILLKFKEDQTSQFLSTISFEEISEGKKDIEIEAYIRDLWRSRINQDYKGNEPLGFCLYVPLFENKVLAQAIAFAEVVKRTLSQVDIEFIGFSYDLAEVMLPKEEATANTLAFKNTTISNVGELVKYRKSNSTFSHFFLISNETNKKSLDFDFSSLVDLLKEFARIYTEHNREAFGTTIPTAPIQGVGLSMISFNESYFVEYLLQNAICTILDREKVLEKSASLTQCADEIDKFLSPRVHMMSELFSNEIKTRYVRGQETTTVIAEVLPILKEKFKELDSNLEEFIINNDSWTLPQKKALISTLLGFDDELFGLETLVNSRQNILMDLEREYLEYFIGLNNRLLEDKNLAGDVILPPFILDDPENKEARLPIDELKEIRYRQRNIISNIRQAEDELELLSKNMKDLEEAEKCVIESGRIHFQDREYKLLPRVDEIPLKDNYTPHKVSSNSVDISLRFSEIRDQGSQGACLAFSLVSVYEYFLRRGGVQPPRLSEQFLYYTARERAGNTDKDLGLTINDAAAALAETGICTDSLCPYNPDGYNIKPSESAYADAAERKVRRIVNVDKNIETIKSAIEDGYPVVGSFTLFDSFTKQMSGFVPVPSEEEVKSLSDDENRNHAMVICGYNDSQRLFKVRNSWGTSWGNAGWCYIPYDYITTPKAISWFAAIEEIAVSQTKKVNEEIVEQDRVIKIVPSDERSLNFSDNDNNVRYAMKNSALGQFRRDLAVLSKRDNALLRYFENLKEPLRDKNRIDVLLNANKAKLNKRMDELEEKRQEVVKEERRNTYIFKKETIKRVAIVTLIFIALFVIFTILNVKYKDIFPNSWVYWLKEKQWISSDNANILPFITFKKILIALTVLYIGGYSAWRYRKYQTLKHKYLEKRRKINREFEEIKEEHSLLDAQVLVGSRIASEIFSIQSLMTTRAAALQHLIINMSEWENSIMAEHAGMEPKEKLSIPLIENHNLDKYYEIIKDKITDNIRIWKYIDGYHPSEEAIIAIKERIKADIMTELLKNTEDFSIGNYMASINDPDRFKFLTHSSSIISDLLEDLIRRSDVTLRTDFTSGPPETRTSIFVNTVNEAIKNNLVNQLHNFIPEASVYNISARNRLIEFNLMNLDLEQVVL